MSFRSQTSSQLVASKIKHFYANVQSKRSKFLKSLSLYAESRRRTFVLRRQKK